MCAIESVSRQTPVDNVNIITDKIVLKSKYYLKLVKNDYLFIIQTNQ